MGFEPITLVSKVPHSTIELTSRDESKVRVFWEHVGIRRLTSNCEPHFGVFSTNYL